MDIQARNLNIVRNEEWLIRHLSFTLAPSQALILKGANGIGKTTLLKALVGLFPLESGEFTPTDISPSCHYVGHENAMKSVLSVRENLRFWCDSSDATATVAAMKKLSIDHLGDVMYSHLSMGQARRVALARLLVSHRPLWILDEPMTGLDTDSRILFTNIMQAHLDSSGIIILAAHEEIELANSQVLDLNNFHNRQ